LKFETNLPSNWKTVLSSLLKAYKKKRKSEIGTIPSLTNKSLSFSVFPNIPIIPTFQIFQHSKYSNIPNIPTFHF